MKFRDDIEPENTWITADTHFGHEDLVGYNARPIDHDQVMLEQWRAHVPDDATVLHLGDLVWKNNAWFKNVIAPRLTGARKLLILGNHDKGRPAFYRDCGFKIIQPFWLGVSPNASVGWRAVLGAPRPYTQYHVQFDHYPHPVANPRDHFTPAEEWHVHGHIHNNGYHDGRDFNDVRLVPFLRNHINVSVEQTRYRPVNLKLLLDAAILGRLPS